LSPTKKEWGTQLPVREVIVAFFVVCAFTCQKASYQGIENWRDGQAAVDATLLSEVGWAVRRIRCEHAFGSSASSDKEVRYHLGVVCDHHLLDVIAKSFSPHKTPPDKCPNSLQ
jgi:hypothetical protein